MKVTRNEQPGFAPFALNITVESEEEARALYAIFNHTNNTALLPDHASRSIKNAIGDWHYVVRRDAEIAGGVTVARFYR